MKAKAMIQAALFFAMLFIGLDAGQRLLARFTNPTV